MIQRARARKTQVSSILNPVDGYRGSVQKKGKKPIDHIRDNTKLVKQSQQEFRKRTKEEEEKSRIKNTKLKKFSNVGSKVYNFSRPFTAQTRTGPNRSMTVQHIDEIEDKENINFENISSDEMPGKTQNFVKRNIVKAWNQKAQYEEIERPSTATEYGGDNYKAKGKVPNYLRSRQEEWKHQEELNQMKSDLRRIPPGTKLLPENERLATLDQLRDSKKEIQTTLETLPISLRTMALRNKKVDLEGKLKEIEAAISLFSKENVYVAI